MKVSVSPATVRATVPVYIEVTDAPAQPKIVVGPANDSATVLQPFTLNPVPQNQIYTATFWMQTPGNYVITVTSGQETVLHSLEIQPQVYLSFGKEFGLFSSSLLIALVGVFLWFRIQSTRKKKCAMDGSV